jgi:predicted 2-oxoglutarate/Fe(II)-dependent dioxygenase YbiX
MKYVFSQERQPTKVLAGAVYVYENACDNWQTIIDSIEKEANDPESGVAFQLATTRDGNWQGKRRNKVLNISTFAGQNNETLRQVHNYFGIFLQEHLISYSKNFDCGFGEHEGYALLKYEGGNLDHYDAHYDGGHGTRRWISAILYLNDDYEGGELEFVAFKEKYKPKAGTLVIFPSTYAYTHIAHTVTKGTKYAIVTWVSED